jgi:dTDP-4-dehydrorhamnose 3,5-epimerase
MSDKSILFTPLDIIESDLGSVRHAMRIDAAGYHGFEEVYFSSINKNKIKGWKKHLRMTMNLVVCYGNVRFAVLSENKLENASLFTMSPNVNYGRLTVPPNYWVAFKGLSDKNLLMNFSNLLHDPVESVNENYDSGRFAMVL